LVCPADRRQPARSSGGNASDLAAAGNEHRDALICAVDGRSMRTRQRPEHTEAAVRISLMSCATGADHVQASRRAGWHPADSHPEELVARAADMAARRNVVDC
jgi:hypothetical protein